jgi:hypothetical protein
MRQFNELELRPKIKGVNMPDPRIVLNEYKQAQKMVKEIQKRYKTEYQSNFLDWSLPKSIKKQQENKDLPLKNVHSLKMGDYEGEGKIIPQQQTATDLKPAKKHKTIDHSKGKIECCFDNLKQIVGDKTKPGSPTKSSKPPLEPKKSPKSSESENSAFKHNILKEQRVAGLDSQECLFNYEKKHFQGKEGIFNIAVHEELDQRTKTARDLLERASSRASTRK